MTDTAEPMPVLTGRGIPPTMLTQEQVRRAAALGVARDTLANRPAIFGGSNVNTWSIGQILSVADWILGEEPPARMVLEARPYEGETAPGLPNWVDPDPDEDEEKDGPPQ